MIGNGARAGPPGRVWWTAPVALAAVAGAVALALSLPGFAGGASVPNRLVVDPSPAPSAAPSAPARQPSPSPSSAAPQHSSTPTTQVVVPERPVVRESDDRTGGPDDGADPQRDH